MTNSIQRAVSDRRWLARVTSAAAVACAAVALAGCGGSAGGATSGHNDQVASIGTPSASGESGAATLTGGVSDGSDKGVQLRLDMSEQEKDRISQAYTHCLKDQGVPSGNKGHAALSFPEGGPDKYPKAYKACESKKPIQPPELDQSRNPDYMDDFRAEIECLDHKGLAVTALSDGSGYNYDYDHMGRIKPDTPQSERAETDCEREAFSAK